MRWGKVWVSPWLLALIALFFAIDKSVYAPLVVLSALLHEMGHLAALRNCGIEAVSYTHLKQNADSVRFEHEILGSLALAEAVDTELGGVFAVGGVQPLLELFSFHADFKEDLRIGELLLG